MNIERYTRADNDVGEVTQEMIDYSHLFGKRFDERFCDTPITVMTRIFFIELKKEGETYETLAEKIGRVGSGTIRSAVYGNAGRIIKPELDNVSATRYVYNKLKEMVPDISVINSEIIEKQKKLNPRDDNTNEYEETIHHRCWWYKGRYDSSKPFETRELLMKEKEQGNTFGKLSEEIGIGSSIISSAVVGAAGFASSFELLDKLRQREQERRLSNSGTGRCDLD